MKTNTTAGNAPLGEEKEPVATCQSIEVGRRTRTMILKTKAGKVVATSYPWDSQENRLWQLKKWRQSTGEHLHWRIGPEVETQIRDARNATLETSGKQEAVTESVEAGDSGLPGGVEAATHVRQKERQHVLDTAGYWFRGSRKAQDENKPAEAIAFMENAYNHVENALAACNDFIADCANGVLMRDGKTNGQRAWELLSRTGGRSLAVSVSSLNPSSPSTAAGEIEIAIKVLHGLAARIDNEGAAAIDETKSFKFIDAMEAATHKRIENVKLVIHELRSVPPINVEPQDLGGKDAR